MRQLNNQTIRHFGTQALRHLATLALCHFATLSLCHSTASFAQENKLINLPSPSTDGNVSIEKTLLQRRSYRDFSRESMSLDELSQLLWACQGITAQVQAPTKTIGLRTAPSAGALYPLEVFAFVKNVSDLPSGIYHYHPGPGINEHSIELIQSADREKRLPDATLGQDCIKKAAVCFIISSVVQRTAVKYGDRSERYVLLEAGHAAQNICLQSEALGLGSVTVGAFYDDKVKALIEFDAEPVYIVCVGKK